MREEDYPYFDETVVFSDNLSPILKNDLENLRQAFRDRDWLKFMKTADDMEIWIKSSHQMGRTSREDLEKFYVMLGRDWWNRSKTVQRREKNRIAAVLSGFPKA